MSTFTRADGLEVARSDGIEVADIFRRHFAAARARHSLGPREQRVARDMMRCRTAALGGHLQSCTSCEFQRPAYNSCRNRHCPKCQALRQARWVQQRCSRILPTHCFHVVFTLPSELHSLARRNRALIFDLLMKSAAASLLELGRDPKWLGESAQLGIAAVLHTWSRELLFHPHVHCIVTGGGLSSVSQRWISAPPDFLFPTRVLGSLFRGKFLAGLERLRGLPNFTDDADDDRAVRRRRAKLYDTNWIVFAKRPFGGSEQVYRYLGRYTHRVAISNSRLLRSNDDAVVFRTRDQKTSRSHPSSLSVAFSITFFLPASSRTVTSACSRPSTSTTAGYRHTRCLPRANCLLPHLTSPSLLPFHRPMHRGSRCCSPSQVSMLRSVPVATIARSSAPHCHPPVAVHRLWSHIRDGTPGLAQCFSAMAQGETLP